MRNSSRSERKQLLRAERREAVKKTSASKDTPKLRLKVNIVHVLTLSSIMVVIVMLLFLSKNSSLSDASFADQKLDNDMLYSSAEDFEKKYSDFIQASADNFTYDKTPEQFIDSAENEISVKQISTSKTNSVIGLFSAENAQIQKIGVIGVYKKDNYSFARGFKENMVLVTAMAEESSYSEAHELLKQQGLINESGDIVLESMIFEHENKEYIFFVKDKKEFFFTASNKVKLVEQR